MRAVFTESLPVFRESALKTNDRPMRAPIWMAESMMAAIIREPRPATSMASETASGVTMASPAEPGTCVTMWASPRAADLHWPDGGSGFLHRQVWA